MNNRIEAYGTYYNGHFEINTSSILTRLIQDAGRWCEHYASDLFIQWNTVERIVSELKPCNENLEFKFGFREMGVDHNEWIELHKDMPYYYRKIRKLLIEIRDEKIEMTLI